MQIAKAHVSPTVALHESRKLKQARPRSARMLTCYARRRLLLPHTTGDSIPYKIAIVKNCQKKDELFFDFSAKSIESAAKLCYNKGTKE